MERRRFLAVAVGSSLLAGCPSRDADADTPTATPLKGTETPTATPDGDDVEALVERLSEGPNVHEFENVPLTVSLHGDGFGSAVTDRTDDGLRVVYGLVAPATDDAPARAVAVLRNGRDYEQTFQLRRIPGFDNPPRGRREAGEHVYLAPTADHDLADFEPGVAQDDDGRWRLVATPSEWFPERLTLGPGEAVVGEYHLVGTHRADDAALVAGDYDFRGFVITAWPTDAPGPAEDSRFADADVPALPVEGETAWFHEADASTEVYLEPSAEAVDPPACIEYELYNRSHDRLSGNPYSWGLFKLDDGEWFRIEPWGIPQPATTIGPGGTDASSLGVYHGDPVECEDDRGVGHLGGGRYAYHVDFARGDETHAALFEFDAPAVDPRPDEDVEVDRDADELVVTMPEWHDEDHPQRAELVFERAGGEPDRRLIPEQLFRWPMRGFRNALPAFEPDVERVVLRADRHVVGDTVGYEDLERRVAYRGETFRVEGEDPARDGS